MSMHPDLYTYCASNAVDNLHTQHTLSLLSLNVCVGCHLSLVMCAVAPILALTPCTTMP